MKRKAFVSEAQGRLFDPGPPPPKPPQPPKLRKHKPSPGISAKGAAQARDAAMDQAEEHATPAWKEAAKQAVYRVCMGRESFLVDDIWPEFERVEGDFAYTGTRDKRAMGPVVVNCCKEGWCESTKTRLPSAIVSTHRGYRTLWNSKLYKEES